MKDHFFHLPKKKLCQSFQFVHLLEVKAFHCFLLTDICMIVTEVSVKESLSRRCMQNLIYTVLEIAYVIRECLLVHN